MEEFHTNFNILGKYSDFNSWQKAELSSPVKKRKREESSEEGEEKRRRFGERYFSAEWTVTNTWYKDTLWQVFFHVGK